MERRQANEIQQFDGEKAYAMPKINNEMQECVIARKLAKKRLTRSRKSKRRAG